MKTEPILIEIFNEIGQRVNTINQAQPAWPCQPGCDVCCRRLPFLPEITQAEWQVLFEGFRQLPISLQEIIKQKVETAVIQEQQDAFITCPLLNDEKGECLVYASRPAACRMYGFYVTRSGNRWCHLIQEKYEAGFAKGIMLGNQQAIDRQLAHNFGESQSLAVWFMRSGFVPPEFEG